MSSVDQFLESVRDAFAKNRAADWRPLVLILVVVVAVTIALSMGLRRWRLRRRIANRIDAVAASARLKPADRDYLREIAAAAGLPALEVMTSLAPFEHATAAALASERPAFRPGEGTAFERVRRLRRALGFSPLPPHQWLLSTRELLEGDPVAMGGGASGRVAEVNEASFAVDLPAAAVPGRGAPVPLFIDRADDARYLVRARLLADEAPPQTESGPAIGRDARRAFFAHDEQPERQQHREHVRVRVHGTVTMRMATGPAAAGVGAQTPETTAPRTIAGSMVDVSAGGLSLELPMSADNPIRRGARAVCSFTLGKDAPFEGLEALVVAAVAGPRAGAQHVRLSFTSLPEAARDRLAAAVAKHQRAPSPDVVAS